MQHFYSFVAFFFFFFYHSSPWCSLPECVPNALPGAQRPPDPPGSDAPNICTYLTPEPQAGVRGIFFLFFFFRLLLCDACLRPAPFVPPPTLNAHTHTVASVWLVWLFGSASVSVIRQLYRGQKKRGKRHIITCFLSTVELDPDQTCKKKKYLSLLSWLRAPSCLSRL